MKSNVKAAVRQQILAVLRYFNDDKRDILHKQ